MSIMPMDIKGVQNIKSGILHAVNDVEVYYNVDSVTAKREDIRVIVTPMCMIGRGWHGDSGRTWLCGDDATYKPTYQQGVTCKSCLRIIEADVKWKELNS